MSAACRARAGWAKPTATASPSGSRARRCDEAQDDATIVTLREQEALGVDIVTDGEQRREGFIFHMCRTWDGIDLVNQVQKDVYRRRNTPRMVPRVTGKLRRRAPATVDDVKFAKAYTEPAGEDGAGRPDDGDR